MSTGLRRNEEFLREVVIESDHGVFAVDSSGTVVFSNGVLEELLGEESGALQGTDIRALATGEGSLERVREAAAGAPGATVEFALRDADGETVGIAATPESTTFEGEQYVTLWCEERRIGSDRPRAAGPSGRSAPPEVSVEELTELWRDLLRAESRAAAAERGLAAITRFVGTDVACLRFLNEDENALERVVTTPAARELIESRPAFDMNRSLAGRALRTGEPVIERPEGVGERDSLHVPLNEDGTLSILGSGEGISTANVDLVENLAAVIAANLDRRAAGGADTFDLPVRDVLAEATGGETRDEIAGRVCERLVEGDAFAGAWFVATDVDGAWRAVEASAGETDTHPEWVRRAEDGTEGADDPVSHAVESREVCLVQRRQTVKNGAWDGEDDESVDTTMVVPVTGVDNVYGVLVLVADCSDSRPALRAELELLGEVVGLSVHAVESRKLLLSERVQQLEFEVTDPSCLAVAVSEATDAACNVQHQTLTNDGDHLCYLQVETASAERARETTASVESVCDCRVIDTGDGSCLLEVTKTRSGVEALMDVGATVRSATAEGGVGTLVVETPLSADVREVVDAYTDLNPESHLVAKREIDRSVSTADALGQRVEDVLTDKQQSVLTSAYFAGYFEWPRANTAEEIADSLGISPATLHQHLRTAERKLLELVCEDEPHPAET